MFSNHDEILTEDELVLVCHLSAVPLNATALEEPEDETEYLEYLVNEMGVGPHELQLISQSRNEYNAWLRQERALNAWHARYPTLEHAIPVRLGGSRPVGQVSGTFAYKPGRESKTLEEISKILDAAEYLLRTPDSRLEVLLENLYVRINRRAYRRIEERVHCMLRDRGLNGYLRIQMHRRLNIREQLLTKIEYLSELLRRGKEILERDPALAKAA